MISRHPQIQVQQYLLDGLLLFYKGYDAHEIPTYIPEGFNLVTEDLDGSVLLVCEKGTDNITYEQIRKRDVSMHINTEGVELEELEFQGFPAKYYSNQGQQNLMWYDDEYLYMVSSTLDRDTVFQISESVKMREE